MKHIYCKKCAKCIGYIAEEGIVIARKDDILAVLWTVEITSQTCVECPECGALIKAKSFFKQSKKKKR